MKPLLIACACLLSAILGIMVYDHVSPKKQKEPAEVHEIKPVEQKSKSGPVLKAASAASQPATAEPAPSLPLALSLPGPKPPVFDWKQFKKVGVELQPLDFQYFDLPAGERTRISLNASSAVFVGVFPAEFLQAARQKQYMLRTADFQKADCSRLSLTEEIFECSPRFRNPVLVVRDKRAEGTVLMGMVGVTRLGGQGVDRATSANKVSVALEKWECVENCTSSILGSAR